MSDAKPNPSFVRLEKAVLAREFPTAVAELLAILNGLQSSHGSFNGFEMGTRFTEGGERELYIHLCTRYAAAFGAIVTASDFELGGAELEALFVYRRLGDMMVRCSGFQTSDHLLTRLPHNEAGKLLLSSTSLASFLLIHSPASQVRLDLDQCYRLNPLVTVLAAIGILAARSCVAPHAVDLRERVLEWLPGKLEPLTLGPLQLGFASEPYMHCSYAFGLYKHRIKGDLIAQFRKALLHAGAQEMPHPPPVRSRPRVVVVCENFHSRHSVFRTHSRAVRALKDGFESIGFCFGAKTDGPARACFERFEEFPSGDVIPCAKATAERILALQPDMVFFLGVGMSPLVIALASLRLAPVQCVSYGHTATTMSPVIDYMILPDDFVGADDIYSEALLRFPPEAIPYAAPVEEPPPPPRAERRRDGKVRIAVPGSIMKINGRFLEALAAASERSVQPVEFQFLAGAARGLAYYHLEHEVKRILPQAVIHPESDRQTYLARLGACDFFVSPFPYGNMNSIVDAVVMGLPGVCLDGPEAHSHADVAIFRRFGLPEDLCTTRVEDYIAQIVRLIDDAEWLEQCRQIAGHVDLEATIYRGDEREFCRELLKLVPGTVAG